MYGKEKGEMSERGTNQTATSIFKVKNVLRALAILSIIFVFCPSFLVSCSGQEMKISAMTAIQGVSVYGQRMVDSYPVMLVTLLVPAGIAALLFMGKLGEKNTAAIILGGTAVDLIFWLIFRWAVKDTAEEYGMEYRATIWFIINMIGLITILIISMMILIGRLHMEMEFASAAMGGDTQKALKQITSTVTQIKGNVGAKNTIGYCTKCGSPITYGSKFCTSCGTPVSEIMVEEAEAAMEAQRRAAEEAQRRAAEEAQRRAAEEAQRRAAEEAQRRAAEDAQRRAAEEAQRRAAEEAQRRAAEEAQRRAAEEAQRRAAEDAQRRAAEDAQKRPAEVSGQSLEDAQRKAAEESVRKVVEEAARKVAEESAKKQAGQQGVQGAQTVGYCPKCGGRLNPNAKFCEFCGLKIK